MNKLFSIGFWSAVARFILRNRTGILIAIATMTVLLALQWKNMRFTYTEANLLPEDHSINLEYNAFLDLFGEEGNIIVIGIKDSTIFTPTNFDAWNRLTVDIEKFDEVEFALSAGNLQKLQKKADTTHFELVPLLKDSILTDAILSNYKTELLENLPFYEGLIYSPDKKSIRSVIAVKKDIINTSERKDFVIDDLIPLIEEFENETGLHVRTSGMPYIRTLNSQSIIDEIGLFVGGALLVTSIIFFFFFRSWRATFISMFTVLIAVMWTFGFLGLFQYEITVLTALIPPLIIVIGIPNCIFLINKYQHEIQLHGNQAKSLQRVIAKVGNATMMTNLTTACGFATFILIRSDLLREFGTIAAISIVALFLLCLFIIPIVYSYMAIPKYRHLKHLNKRWINAFINWIERMVKERQITIYITALVLVIVSIIGIYNIKISGSLIEDMPKNTGFFDDIRFFENEFEGIMPVEILVDTKRERGVMRLSTLRRIDELQEVIHEIPEFAKPLSVVELVKYSKQAYYNGNPDYYQLPNSQEQSFILSYAKSSGANTDLLNSYVDPTGQFARITSFMKDTEPDRFNRIEEDLNKAVEKIFPEERYNISVTGKALVFQKGTHYLVKNLFLSLSLAILLIAVFMAWMFRSFKMILISLIPNILPLIITAGVMGFVGVPIKPSTILVFSVAFGITVDDTIHFLAKYRQELVANKWKIKKSVFAALRETGVSMFYTSIVLFFGFSVFTISSFGGTVALGALVSVTLLFAMLSNLLLLPTLLLSLERRIANKETMRKPSMEILTDVDLDEKNL